MSKSYIFTLDKYYTEDEIAKVSPIIENFVNFYADENGVAVLKLKDDVSIIVKRDEGLALHMVLDNPDRFTALPKKLTKARDFLRTFVVAMAEAVEEKKKEMAEAKKKETIDVASAKAKVENDAEDALLGYITPKADAPVATEDEAAAPATEPKTTVKVNGKEITDPAEKEKVIAEMEAKREELRAKANKMFNETFDKVFKSLAANDWLSDYLN